MEKPETAKAISEAAAEWVARVDRSGSDAEVRAGLEAWLADDTRRQGAYFRAQSAWAMLDRASVMATGAQEEPEEPHALLLSRRFMLWGGGAMAASLVAAATGFQLLSTPAERIETAIGEIRRVPLGDGSMAAVNTGTKLAVRLQPKIREIAIDRGEVWFQVAKDKSRPFVVEAGDVRVRAVGTAFSVRRTDDGADVQVSEGVVEVWSTGDPGNVRRVSAGQRTFVSEAAGPHAVADGDIERGLSWRSGQLIFDGDTLGEAVAEFNRYNRVQVRVADPGLAAEAFVGRFRTNEPDAFARAAATLVGARATIGPDEIVLTRK